MKNAQIIILDPERWEEYKNLRMKALRTDPYSFGLTYEEALKREDKEWKRMLIAATEAHIRWTVFAELKGELIGMAQATVDGEVIKIKSVFVDPEYRNKGLGKKILLQLFEEIKRGSSIKKIHLGVYLPNEKALKLYQSLGAKEISRGVKEFPDGRKKPRVLMEINLD